MLICPHCKTAIGEKLPDNNACPRCGHRFASADAATQVHKAPTWDMAEMIKPADKAPPPAPAQPKGHSMTIAPRKLSIKSMEKITNTWQAAIHGEAGPQTSLKFDSKAATGMGSSLVVNQRGVREVKDRTMNAEGADYELLEVIGKGGMGVVYSARQASVDRMVAVKMIRPQAASDLQRREKFLSEAVVTGDLDHPNIVPIYELGTNESNALFYSMKRVQGTPWSEMIYEKSLLDNLEILMKVADAVAFAHANGVIHRDLKPENVMLGDYGEVLVMDWGLAVATKAFRHADFVTGPDSMGGTPAYMAPEMVTGPFELINEASDIYLLGAMLFEILTGLRPHQGDTAQECLLSAARNEIQHTEMSGELVEIAYRAMATDPGDRYATVQDFQAAIRDYHTHSESISLSTRAERELSQATSGGDYQSFAHALFGYQEAVALWDGNSRAKSGISEARLAYATCAKTKGDFELGVSLLEADDEQHALLRAELAAAQKEREARQKWLYRLKRIAAALVLLVFGVITASLFVVAQAKNRESAAKDQAIGDKIAAQAAEREADQARAKEQIARQQEEEQKIQAIAARERAEQEEAKAIEAEKKARDAEEEERRQKVKAIEAENAAVAAKRGEKYSAYIARIGMAAAKVDENAFDAAASLLAACLPEEGEADLRNWEWGHLQHLSRHGVNFPAEGTINAVAFARAARWFVTAGDDGNAQLWNIDDGKPLAKIAHGAPVMAMAVSPDSQFLALAGADGKLQLARASDGATVQTFAGHVDRVTSVAFAPQGRWLASGSRDRTIRIWDLASGRQVEGSPLRGHNWWVWSVGFSPDGKQIVSAGEDGKVIVWSFDAAGSRPQVRPWKTFLGHQGPVFCAAFSPDNRQVVSGGYDKRVLLWEPAAISDVNLDSLVANQPVAPQPCRDLAGHSAPLRSVEFSHDGQYVISAGDDNTVRIWDAFTGRLQTLLRGHSRPVQSCALSPDGRLALSGGQEGQIKLWNLLDYKQVRAAEGRLLEGHDDAIFHAGFSRDGRQIVTASRDHSAIVYDATNGKALITLKEGHEFLASRAVYSNDGRWLMTAGGDSSVRIWDATSGAQLAVIEGTGRNAAAVISSDGRLVFTGRTATLDPSGRSPDAPRTAQTIDPTRPALALWDLDADGHLVGEHKLDRADFGTTHRGNVTVLAMSADSRRLFSGDDAGTGKLWDATTGALLATLKSHTSSITGAAFLPNGRVLLTSSVDGTVARWDVATGREVAPALAHADPRSRDAYDTPVTALAITPDGAQAVTLAEETQRGSRQTVIRVWDLAAVRILREVYRGDDDISSISLSGDGREILSVHMRQAAGQAPSSVVLRWDLAAGREITSPDGSPYLVLGQRRESIWSAIDAPGGGVLTVGGNGAAQWNPRDTSRAQWLFKPHGGVTAADFSPSGKRLVTGSSDERVKIWDLARGQVDVQLPREHTRTITSATFSPRDEQLLLTASNDGTARLWRLPDTSVVHVLRHRADAGKVQPIHQAIFTPDGARVLTASEDGTIGIWDAASGGQLASIAVESPVLAIACSADGRHLMAGCGNGQAMIFDLTTGEEIVRYLGHTSAVNSVALSPDGTRALSGSSDRTAKLWDTVAATRVAGQADPFRADDGPADAPANLGREMLTLKHHDQAVTSVAFSPDGRQILTAGLDGTAVVWIADDWQ